MTADVSGIPSQPQLAEPGPRPKAVVAVTGTATDIGKTWVGVKLLTGWLESGLSVAARKPVQSFSPGDLPSDADLLSAASGERWSTVCPSHRWYSAPMAPPMAAEFLFEEPFTIADLVGEIRWPSEQVDIGLVETAGGVKSPVADDGCSADLADGVNPDLVLLVSGATLGSINDVSLSIGALRQVTDSVGNPTPVKVILTRYDEEDLVQRKTREWLVDRLQLDVAHISEETAGGIATSIASSLGLVSR